MPKATLENLDNGQLELMWNFLRFGKQKPNVPALKEHLDAIRQCMIQKTAGQRKDDPKEYINMNDIGTHINCVVIEAMCLYLSGALDKLEQDG